MVGLIVEHRLTRNRAQATGRPDDEAESEVGTSAQDTVLIDECRSSDQSYGPGVASMNRLAFMNQQAAVGRDAVADPHPLDVSQGNANLSTGQDAEATPLGIQLEIAAGQSGQIVFPTLKETGQHVIRTELTS